jgi:hypothetical protein
MSLLASYTDLDNFWVLHPQLSLDARFRTVHEEDKSKHKTHSSRLMYGLVFLVDPSPENKFYNLTEVDKKYLIAQEIFGNKEFNWEDEKIEALIRHIEDFVLTPAKRSLRNWKKKLEERDQMLAEIKYSLENATELDKILAQTDKLYSQYERVAKALEVENQESKVRGGRQLSLSDKGEI